MSMETVLTAMADVSHRLAAATLAAPAEVQTSDGYYAATTGFDGCHWVDG